jgi:hypothetical protein
VICLSNEDKKKQDFPDFPALKFQFSDIKISLEFIQMFKILYQDMYNRYSRFIFKQSIFLYKLVQKFIGRSSINKIK